MGLGAACKITKSNNIFFLCIPEAFEGFMNVHFNNTGMFLPRVKIETKAAFPSW